jgi:monoamine oxidase
MHTQMDSGRHSDVVVVGAGLAGLACGRALLRAGRTVRILEARPRVGGRTWSEPMGRAIFDRGGQWLGPGQDRLAALVREYALPTFPTWDEGRKLLEYRGELAAYDGTIPRLPALALLDLHLGLRRLDALTRQVAKPALSTPDAHRLDGTSVGQWMDAHLNTDAARAVVAAALRVVFGAEPEEISLLYALDYARAGGGFMKLVEIRGGAQETRFVHGAQSVALALAAELGERVTLDAPVRAIDQSGNTGRPVVVHSDAGPFTAERVVVALPPALAAGIAFAPALPPPREQVHQRMPMGATVKVHLLYDRPFWRARGFSGEAVFERGPISVVFDNTSHDGAQPALLAFIVGDPARTWSLRPEAVRRETVLRLVARLFGEAARHPTAYVEIDWSTEPWSRGCPVGVFAAGSVRVAGPALQAPTGRIHWAGTETATVFTGYMEGALQSAERVFEELVPLLP